MDEKWMKDVRQELDALPIPDVRERVLQTHQQRSPKTRRVFWPIFWRVSGVFTCLCAITIGGYFLLSGPRLVPPSPPIQNNKDAFAFEAVSAISLLSSPSSQQARMLERRAFQNEQEFATVVDQLHPLLPFIDQTLSADRALQVESKTSDRQKYEHFDYVTSSTYWSETKHYSLYYNAWSEHEVDEDESETTTTWKGILVDEQAEYEFTLEGEIENEDDEIEQELVFTLYLSATDYIVSSREIETDEEDFVFERYENGECLFEASIEYERDSTEVEATIKYESEDHEWSYRFQNIFDEQHRVRLTTSQNERIEIYHDLTEDYYVYLFYNQDGEEIYRQTRS